MRKFSLSDLRVRLLLVVLFALIPVFGLLLYLGWEQRLAATIAANENALKLTRETVREQQKLISETRQLLGELAQRPDVDTKYPVVCSAALAHQLERHPKYLNFGAVDSDGKLTCSALPLKGPINIADRGYFQQVFKTKDFSVGEYQIGRITGKPSINFGYPKFDTDGKIKEVVFAALGLDWLNAFLTNAPRPPGSLFTVFDQNGTILARSAEGEKWLGKSFPEAPIIKAVLATALEGTAKSRGVDGIDRIYAFSPLAVSGKSTVYVAVGIAKDDAYRDVTRTTVRNLMLLGLLTVLALAAAVFGADLLVLRKVGVLVKATKRIAAGDLHVRTGLGQSKGELGQLAGAFDEMADSLERNKAQLQKANRALRTLSKCNETLVRAADETDLLNETCRTIVETGGYRMAWVGYTEQDEGKTIRPVALAGYEPSYVEAVKFTWADNQFNQEPIGTAVRTGKPGVVKAFPIETHAFWTVEAAKRGYPAFLVLPLISHGIPFGALSIYASDPDAFDIEEEKLLTELAANLTNGITTLRMRAAHREIELRFEMLVGSVQDYAICMLDPRGRVASWNTGAERIKGYKAEEIVGEHFSRFYTPEDIHAGKPAKALRIAQAQEKFANEGWRVRKDGSRFWANVSMTSIRDESGNLKGFAKVTRDLTETKRVEEEIRQLNQDLDRRVIERTVQLERANLELKKEIMERERVEESIRKLNADLQQRTEEMADMNKELESFSYSVSHDLRAPLRRIDGFSQALLEDYADKLDEAGKGYLERVRASTQQMGGLIEDLLNLSRIGRKEMNCERVNLTAVAQALAAELQHAAPGRAVEFVIADGLEVHGDAGLLQVVMSNLLGNAWKYTSKHPRARIEVGFAPNNGESTYFVRDDGAGFDMAYAGKLFGAFQRLHGEQEFPGTGIGLATVQRIVHRHGGRVWTESQVDKGATFFFTLSRTEYER